MPSSSRHSHSGALVHRAVVICLQARGYVSSLKVYHDSSVNKSARERRPRKTVDKWEDAMSAAVRASRDFRDAETKRQTRHCEGSELHPCYIGCQMANLDMMPLNVGIPYLRSRDTITSLERRYGITTFNGIVSNHLTSNVVWMQFQSFTNQN